MALHYLDLDSLFLFGLSELLEAFFSVSLVMAERVSDLVFVELGISFVDSRGPVHQALISCKVEAFCDGVLVSQNDLVMLQHSSLEAWPRAASIAACGSTIE